MAQKFITIQLDWQFSMPRGGRVFGFCSSASAPKLQLQLFSLSSSDIQLPHRHAATEHTLGPQTVSGRFQSNWQFGRAKWQMEPSRACQTLCQATCTHEAALWPSAKVRQWQETARRRLACLSGARFSSISLSIFPFRFQF